VLYPNPELSAKYSDDFTEDYFTQFQNDLPAGTWLYSVVSIHAPGAKPVVIGKVVTKSNFTTSKYADSTLFLKHVRYEDDLAVNPDFKDWLCPTMEDCKVCPVDIPCDQEPVLAEETM
jgi:hypothetical protein